MAVSIKMMVSGVRFQVSAHPQAPEVVDLFKKIMSIGQVGVGFIST
jgi:hypothetical protein